MGLVLIWCFCALAEHLEHFVLQASFTHSHSHTAIYSVLSGTFPNIHAHNHTPVDELGAT